MTKKEFQEKIAKNKAKDKVSWALSNLRELYNYVEIGEKDWLREKALHAIREVLRLTRICTPYGWII